MNTTDQALTDHPVVDKSTTHNRGTSRDNCRRGWDSKCAKNKHIQDIGELVLSRGRGSDEHPLICELVRDARYTCK